MKERTTALIALLALMTGCTATSAPTYDAQTMEVSGKIAYEVECRGLAETKYTCIDTARRICLDRKIRPIDRTTGKPIAFNALDSERVMTFACEDQVVPVQERAALPEPVATIPLSTDVLFEFDRSDLASVTATGQRELEKMMVDIGTMSPERLIVSGYTDRIGSDAHNLALSTGRAESIRHFLLDRGVRIPILARGYGKRVPGTSCTMQERAALIDCLSPDRMVEITVMAHASNPAADVMHGSRASRNP